MTDVTVAAPGVLVVDDEPGVRELLRSALRLAGFQVWLASNGVEALDLYLRHRDHVSAVLLDVRMPELDGPQTLRALRQVAPDLPCCLMSGDAGPYDTADLLGLGARHVFPKPFRVAEVADALRLLAAGIAAAGASAPGGRPAV